MEEEPSVIEEEPSVIEEEPSVIEEVQEEVQEEEPTNDPSETESQTESEHSRASILYQYSVGELLEHLCERFLHYLVHLKSNYPYVNMMIQWIRKSFAYIILIWYYSSRSHTNICMQLALFCIISFTIIVKDIVACIPAVFKIPI